MGAGPLIGACVHAWRSSPDMLSYRVSHGSARRTSHKVLASNELGLSAYFYVVGSERVRQHGEVFGTDIHVNRQVDMRVKGPPQGDSGSPGLIVQRHSYTILQHQGDL